MNFRKLSFLLSLGILSSNYLIGMQKETSQDTKQQEQLLLTERLVAAQERQAAAEERQARVKEIKLFLQYRFGSVYKSGSLPGDLEELQNELKKLGYPKKDKKE